MKFYRFETSEAFQGAVGTNETEFVKDGIQFSVVGKIPDGGSKPLLNRDVWEAQQTPPEEQKGQPDDPVIAKGGEQKPDGTTYKKGEAVMQPTFKDGWHVNASGEVDGWDDMAVVPSKPMRVFG